MAFLKSPTGVADELGRLQTPLSILNTSYRPVPPAWPPWKSLFAFIWNGTQLYCAKWNWAINSYKMSPTQYWLHVYVCIQMKNFKIVLVKEGILVTKTKFQLLCRNAGFITHIIEYYSVLMRYCEIWASSLCTFFNI